MEATLEVKYNKLSKLKNLDNKINEIVSYCKTITDEKLETYLTLICENKNSKSYLDKEKQDYSMDFSNSYQNFKDKYRQICDLMLNEEETLVMCDALHSYLVKQKKQLEDELA